MTLNDAQLSEYHERGYIQIDDMFSDDEIRVISEHADADLQTPSDRRVQEASSDLVRAVHGSHLDVPFFTGLVRLPRLLEAVRQIVRDDAYIHQFKINAKAALGGEAWEWHQDSYFWRTEDGMADMNAVNIVIHLDEVNDANGPLLLVPGSHNHGDLPIGATTGGNGDWESTVSVSLKHVLDRPALADSCSRHGIYAAKGRAGSVLLFHPSVIHGSTANMSPFDRRLLILSYNAVSNKPASVPWPRPEFLAARLTTSPLTALETDELPSFSARRTTSMSAALQT